MTLLSRIERGRTPMPPRIITYGVEGVGKSTFASESLRPIFIQTEDGLGQIECDKFPLAGSFEEVHRALGELHTEDHDFETVVIDSLDWLERLIWDAVCNGLAMSSRNRYLSDEERQQALAIFSSLRNAKKAITGGLTEADSVITQISTEITAAGGEIDYVEIIDAENLTSGASIDCEVLIAVAAVFGITRLIDNLKVNLSVDD